MLKNNYNNMLGDHLCPPLFWILSVTCRSTKNLVYSLVNGVKCEKIILSYLLAYAPASL